MGETALESKLDPNDAAKRLLSETCALAAELHPSFKPAGRSLDDKLDAGFGLDSLGRVELLSRLEEAFGVALPEHAMAIAETPRDLLRALLSAAPLMHDAAFAMAYAEARPESYPLASPLPLAAFPSKAKTLVEAAKLLAAAAPNRLHIRFYDDQEDGETLTYGQLMAGAASAASGLQRLGLEAGQTVMIMLPTSREYFFSFMGIMLAGGAPVPIYPPARPNLIEQHIIKHARIADNCLAKTLIVPPEALAAAALLKAHCQSIDHVITPEKLSNNAAPLMTPAINQNDIAFLQYTSGSTGDPKGVTLSHANLLANIRAMGEALAVTPSDAFVSWLPLYHDMGLIGAWLGSLYHGIPLTIMPPLAFLARPRRWLWAIHRHGGTISAAPNFAYEQCLNRIQDKDIEGLDLSRWRAALNGAEAVSPGAIDAFAKRFQPYGFKPTAMMPVYGLAECSVGLAFPPLGQGPLIDRIDRNLFASTGRAMPAKETGLGAKRVAACGRPLARHQIRVVDAAGHELPERFEGHLQFKGPSATSGYFRNAEATRKLFDGEWLQSGDLAYIAGGDVHITGRIKDMIIRAGRNIYPDEIEQAVGLIAGLRKGNVAVFSCQDEDSKAERLIVLAETRESKQPALDSLRAKVNEAVTGVIGEPPDDVLLAPPGSAPKTSSGKIRRAACRQIYLAGAIGKPDQVPNRYLLALSAARPILRRALSALGAMLYGGLFWAWLVLLASLVWILAAALPLARWRWAAARAACKLLLAAPGITIEVRGLDHLPPPGTPCVYVCNHASYLDACILLASLPRDYAFVAKAELANQFLPHIFLSRINALFVERFDQEKSAAGAAQMVETVKAGRSILLFPEGTCQRAPGLMAFQMGGFTAAAAAQALVIPLTIRGSRTVLRSDTWLPRKGIITVCVDAPIELGPGFEQKSLFTKALSLRDKARQRILSRCGEPDLGEERILDALAPRRNPSDLI